MKSIQQFINWGLWINKNEFEILSQNKQVTKGNKTIASTWGSKVYERILSIVCGCTLINTHRQWVPLGKGREEWGRGGIHRSLRFTHVLFLKLAGEDMGLCCFLHIWYACNVSEAIKWQPHPGYLLEESCMCSVQQTNRTVGRVHYPLNSQLQTPNPSSCYSFCLSLVPSGKSSLAQLPHSSLHMPTSSFKAHCEKQLSGPSLEPYCLAL